VIVQHAEGDTCILRICKIQKARNYRNIIAKTQASNGPGFCYLVDHKNPAGDGEIT